MTKDKIVEEIHILERYYRDGEIDEIELSHNLFNLSYHVHPETHKSMVKERGFISGQPK